MTHSRLLCAGLLACSFAFAGWAPAQDSGVQPDNTKANKHMATTADRQKNNLSDRQLTQQIRKAVMSDKTLSSYAHNVKVISQNGSVTLKGPVRSEDEKRTIAAKAAEIAGGTDRVTDELTVKPPSQ